MSVCLSLLCNEAIMGSLLSAPRQLLCNDSIHTFQQYRTSFLCGRCGGYITSSRWSQFSVRVFSSVQFQIRSRQVIFLHWNLSSILSQQRKAFLSRGIKKKMCKECLNKSFQQLLLSYDVISRATNTEMFHVQRALSKFCKNIMRSRMRLLLAKTRHFTVAVWMPVRLSATAPDAAVYDTC
jgi:hypothetical protein